MREIIVLTGVVARRELLTALRSCQGLAVLIALTFLLAAGAGWAMVAGGLGYADTALAVSYYFRAQTWLFFWGGGAGRAGVGRGVRRFRTDGGAV